MQHWEPIKIPRTNLIAQARGVFLKLTAARVMFLIFRPVMFLEERVKLCTTRKDWNNYKTTAYNLLPIAPGIN